MSSSKPLSGKVALITGSTSGIGLGIAQALAAQGADVMLNGFGDTALISSLIKAISDEHGVRALHHPADMSKPVEIEEMIRSTESRLGRIDVLVNNAGIQHVAPVEDFPVDRWDAVIAINLSSAFHTIRTALPGMKKRGYGRIINIASVHGLVASANKTAYVAAKHGIVGLTKAGWVLTPLVQKQVDARAEAKKLSNAQAKHDLLIEKQPSAEFVTPKQLGDLAVFLCSDAASQVRGAAWNMDGGWAAQ